MLNTFEIEASRGASASVIWMHGLGAGPRDFESVVPLLKAPHIRFVFPAAPARPITINGGMSMPGWYDILTLQDPPLRESEPDVRQSALEIGALIARETQRDIPSERIVLVGFSQGGAMALHCGLRHPSRLAGIVSLSGYLLLPEHLEGERMPDNARTRILLCHGSDDPMVPLALGQAANAYLTDLGYPVEQQIFKMGHSMCQEEVDSLAKFLADALPTE